MASGTNPFAGGSGALKPGVILDGKYEMLGLLGAGGMGEVYKARHVHLHTFRCIKIMKPLLMADETYRQRFLREARLATQIHHPNLAVVHDFSILDDGTSYMVTEYIDGTTIRQWSTQHGRFPLALAAEVAVQVLAGLDHIHRRGLLHRDISADNVMLAYDGDDRLVAKIIDLGVAKDVSSNVDTTQSGMLIGNPKYMSPEQLGELAEGEQLDGRADLYCLGVVLYEMLLGVPPFVSKTPNGYIIKHLTEQPPPFRRADPDVEWPGGLEAAVFKALEKDRRNRYLTAREFAQSIGAFMTRTTGTYTRADVERMQQSGFEKTMVVALPTEVVHSDAMTGAMDPEESFHLAFEDGRPAAFEQYLQVFPESSFAPRVRECLAESVDYEDASKDPTIDTLREFIKRWPEGRHRLEAEIRLADLKEQAADSAWQSAVAADSYTAIRSYAMKFPAFHAEEAERRIEERLAFDGAAAMDTEHAWSEYLETWGDDPHAGAARERLESARSREETAWAAAMSSRTTGAWDAYLDEFPDGRRTADAERNRREAAAFEGARTSRSGIEEFLLTYPDGLWAKDAKQLARQLGDDEDFADARKLDTAAAWALYLTMHPAGAHRDEARRHADAARERDEAEVRAREPRDFDHAWETGTTAAWDEYLASHPRSPRLDEARHCRQEAHEFEMAVEMNKPVMWRAFLKAWPDGRHRLDAELRSR
jgi:serine/threonine protein kinase